MHSIIQWLTLSCPTHEGIILDPSYFRQSYSTFSWGLIWTPYWRGFENFKNCILEALATTLSNYTSNQCVAYGLFVFCHHRLLREFLNCYRVARVDGGYFERNFSFFNHFQRAANSIQLKYYHKTFFIWRIFWCINHLDFT